MFPLVDRFSDRRRPNTPPVVIINGLAAILFMIGYVLFGVARNGIPRGAASNRNRPAQANAGAPSPPNMDLSQQYEATTR